MNISVITHPSIVTFSVGSHSVSSSLAEVKECKSPRVITLARKKAVISLAINVIV